MAKQEVKESTKPVIAKKDDYPDGLKEAMAELPHVDVAYISGGKNGHWHFNRPMLKTQTGKKSDGSPVFKTEPKPGYSVVYREDILGEEGDE